MKVMALSDFLRQKLVNRNLSEVARTIGVSRSVLNQWVNGKRVPSLSNIEALKKLAAHLGTDLESMLSGKNNEKVISTVIFKDEKRQYRIKIERID